jgi:hypothetical protein
VAGEARQRWHEALSPQGGHVPLPPRRRLLHALVIAAGWLIFAWSWHRVTAASPELGELRLLMLGALVVVPPLTLGWVAHNVGIHRRKGPRRSVTAVALRYDTDFNGRRIDADWSRLARARRIDIVVDGEHKRFVADERPLAVSELAAEELA